ncbi:MAG TPA: YraN family protein [Syntrophomonadaceae bacterium]|nr:YraN family protein [Syntrophomonadaceae bacterium]
MSFYRRRLGAAGEEVALSYLLKQGYRLLEKNYRCRFGEIDLIVEDGKTVVFIEVKTRSSCLFGLPQEAVGCSKQTKIRRLAQNFLLSRGLEEKPVRFDVIAVLYSKTGDFDIEHLKGVF